jgi:hypothetical protein
VSELGTPLSGRDREAILSSAEGFDAAFFGFSPREAETLGVRQRRFLECAWEAFEDAGCRVGEGTDACGVYAGVGGPSGPSPFDGQPALQAGRFQGMLGHDADYVATRVSHRLGLTGPSFSVTSDRASALSAVHLACESLWAGEIDLALAGGDASPSEGPIRGPDIGLVVLRRLDDALELGHTVRATISGSAVAHDGAFEGGRGCGSQLAISAAWRAAGLEMSGEPIPEVEGVGGLIRTSLELWRRGGDSPARWGAGASSRGGSHAYLLLERAPVAEKSRGGGPARHREVLALSAPTEGALERMSVRLAGHLRAHPDLDLGDVAHTLQVGRKDFRFRRVVVAYSLEEAVAKLAEPPADEETGSGEVERLARLWLAGAKVEWPADPLRRRIRLPLPTYPFERRPEASARLGAALEREPGADGPSAWAEVPYWQPAALPSSAAQRSRRGRWLIVPDREGFGQAVGDRLAAAGDEVIRAEPDGRDLPSSFLDTLETDGSKGPLRVLHLACLEGSDGGGQGLDPSLQGLFRLALAADQSGAVEELVVGARGLHAVFDGETMRTEIAAALGLGELRRCRCRFIDVCSPESSVEQLLVELLAEDGETHVAYRGHGRWVRRVEPIELGRLPARSDRALPLKLLLSGPEGRFGDRMAGDLAGKGARLVDARQDRQASGSEAEPQRLRTLFAAFEGRPCLVQLGAETEVQEGDGEGLVAAIAAQAAHLRDLRRTLDAGLPGQLILCSRRDGDAARRTIASTAAASMSAGFARAAAATWGIKSQALTFSAAEDVGAALWAAMQGGWPEADVVLAGSLRSDGAA